MVDHQLPYGPYKISDQDVDYAARNTMAQSDLVAAMVDPDPFMRRLVGSKDDLSRRLETERILLGHAQWRLGKAEKDQSRRKRRIYWITVVIEGLILLSALASALTPDPSSEVDAATEPLGYGFELFLILFYSVLAVGVATWRIRAGNPVTSARRERDDAWAFFRSRLSAEVDGLARSLANGPEFLASGARSALLLSTREAPTLIERDSAIDTVPARASHQITQMIDAHGTSAIGVSGPRGVGKTTILRRQCEAAGVLGVYVSAPVHYSGSDFLRLLHTEVAEAMLDQGSPTLTAIPDAADRRLGFLVAAGVAGFTIGAGVLIVDNSRWTMAEATGFLIAFAGLGLVSRAFVDWRQKRSKARASTDVNAFALEELDGLRWRTSYRNRRRTGLSLGASVSRDDEDETATEERERTHPEAVAAFKRFLRRYQTLDDRKLVIAVDELDKLSVPEHAVEMVNNLKDVLHVDGTHFLVSVSEDAVANFALRGIPLRDAFDSTFDTVLRVQPFEARESLQLLERRVLYFPIAFGLLCHSIAGGLPRDVIRAARYCVDSRNAAEKDLEIAAVAQCLCASELCGALDAAMHRSSGSAYTPEDYWLLSLREVARRGLLSSDEVAGIDLAALGQRGVESATVTGGLVIYSFLLATINDYFTMPRSEDEWNVGPDSVAHADCANAFASVRQAIATSPIHALRLLGEAREIAQMGELPDVLTRFFAPDRLAARDDRQSRQPVDL